FFFCALLCKSIVVTLPAILLLLHYFYGKRLEPRRWTATLPFFVLAALFAIGDTLYAHSNEGPGLTGLNFGVIDRIVIAGHALWFYLAKLIWPIPLMAI